MQIRTITFHAPASKSYSFEGTMARLMHIMVLYQLLYLNLHTSDKWVCHAVISPQAVYDCRQFCLVDGLLGSKGHPLGYSAVNGKSGMVSNYTL